ncbi:MAG: hypothetical protein AMXMBFR8_12090 [Nevskiales bacterium]
MWYLKIPVKIILARLPVSYRLFRMLGMFRHGEMDSAGYAVSVFMTHLGRARTRGLSERFTALELGPGDSVAAALLAKIAGAEQTFLTDAGPFANHDMDVYRSVARHSVTAGRPAPDSIDFTNLETFLASCNAQYLTNGLSSLRKLPNESIDFLWSHAVLEHIRLKDFPALVAEMRRVIRPAGICSHRVDLRDHLSGGLNNLRFPENLWESDFMARSGFYTNRIGFGQMLGLFDSGGFTTEILNVDRWSTPPINRSAIHPAMLSNRSADLCVSGFDVVLRPAISSAD